MAFALRPGGTKEPGFEELEVIPGIGAAWTVAHRPDTFVQFEDISKDQC